MSPDALKKIELKKYLNVLNQTVSISLVQTQQNFVYALPKEVSTKCRGKNTFLRCEGLSVSWDLKYLTVHEQIFYFWELLQCLAAFMIHCNCFIVGTASGPIKSVLLVIIRWLVGWLVTQVFQKRLYEFFWFFAWD